MRERIMTPGAKRLLLTAALLLLTLALNLGISALPKELTRLDTTPDRRFTLTQETREILSHLDREVTLVLIAGAGQEDGDLSGLLDRYGDESDYLRVVHVDPAASPAALRQYAGEEAEEPEANSVLVLCGDTRKLLNYRYDIYTYSNYADYYQNYYYYGVETLDAFVAERSLTAAIRYVTDPEKPAVYVLTGHGEMDLSGLYGEMELENLRVEDLDLRLSRELPADCAVLLIAAPQRDLSEAECDALRRYIQAGGKILALGQYAQGTDLQRFYALMEELWGLRPMEGTVFERDEQCYVYYPFYLYPHLESHPITEALVAGGYRVVIPDAQALVSADPCPWGVALTDLVTTSDSAFLHSFGEGEDADDYDFQWREGDPEGPFSLAVAGEREDGGRLVWLGGVYLLDSMVGEMSAGANMDLYLNALGWLADRQESLSIREITAQGGTMTMSAAAVTAMTAALAGAVPLTFLAVGGFRVWKRRRRR